MSLLSHIDPTLREVAKEAPDRLNDTLADLIRDARRRLTAATTDELIAELENPSTDIELFNQLTTRAALARLLKWTITP